MSSLETFSKSGSNTLREYLVGIKSEGGKQFRCRQLQNLHYVDVRPEPSNGPLELLHFSQSMAEELGIDPEADLEGAASDKLEDELRDGLKNLFGNN